METTTTTNEAKGATMKTSNAPRLTPEQKTILLRLCDAAESARPLAACVVRLEATNKNRETSTGCALVRKGLATRNRAGLFAASLDGFWLGDTLRTERRLVESKGGPR